MFDRKAVVVRFKYATPGDGTFVFCGFNSDGTPLWTGCWPVGGVSRDSSREALSEMPKWIVESEDLAQMSTRAANSMLFLFRKEDRTWDYSVVQIEHKVPTGVLPTLVTFSVFLAGSISRSGRDVVEFPAFIAVFVGGCCEIWNFGRRIEEADVKLANIGVKLEEEFGPELRKLLVIFAALGGISWLLMGSSRMSIILLEGWGSVRSDPHIGGDQIPEAGRGKETLG